MTDPITRLNAALEGRYAIEREIGEGGMATVYLAEDLRHERKVALKVLKPELAAVVGAERFLAEIKTTANLQHPHILPLHDSGEVDGFLYYVMPYVEGETLRDRIDRERQLPVDEAVALATKVAGALQHAHEQGVIHRDIKPGNILLQGGEPVVADFGIALAVGVAGRSRLTETGLSVGTPYYMSPEEATGDQEVGPASDTFALACVLYEMLVGEPPYPGNTAQAVLGKIIQGLPVSATAVRKSVPVNVDAAIRKALETLPADRFTAAQDFAKALADPGFRHGEEAAAGVALGRGQWTGLAVAVTGLAVVLALALGWSLLRPEPPRTFARFELTLPAGLQAVTSGSVDLAVSPDGSQVVFVGVSTEGGTQLWLRPLDQLSPIPIPGTAGARSPRFSPDGGSIAFFTNNGSLTIASLSGGPPLTVVSESASPPSLAWGPDDMLYFRKQDLGIWRVPANGGEQEEITVRGSGFPSHSLPDVLPNAKGILFTRYFGGLTGNEIAILSLETGEMRVLFQGAMARYAHSGHIVYASGDGTLLAVPFDVDRLEVTGPARALLDGVQVLPTSASYFALSETGVLIYRPGAVGAGGIPVWVGRDGSEEVLDPVLSGSFTAPAISPDGRRVALQHTPVGGTTDIWIYDLDQETFSRLTFESVNWYPFWSPDGSEVGFSSNRDGRRSLYARPSDFSGEARLLRAWSDETGSLLDALWTPDSRWLVYQGGPGLGSDLFYAAPDPDSAPIVFLNTPFAEDTPSLSPDGRWLAYQSNESGQSEVYVRPFPGPGGRSQVSVNGGTGPVWAHNGREIFYMAADNSWVVATVWTDPDFAVDSRERFASAEGFADSNVSQQFDLSRDDQRLLAIRVSTPGTQVRDVVVLNFFEELRQVVPE